MLCDSRSEIRSLGVQRIMEAREEQLNMAAEVRQFRVPELNSDAADYTNLIDWS